MYRLYSRRTGWEGGTKIRYFMSRSFDEKNVDLGAYVDRKASDIIRDVDQDGVEVSADFRKECGRNGNWYLYLDGAEITSSTSE